jgi:hypothetical protein
VTVGSGGIERDTKRTGGNNGGSERTAKPKSDTQVRMCRHRHQRPEATARVQCAKEFGSVGTSSPSSLRSYITPCIACLSMVLA